MLSVVVEEYAVGITNAEVFFESLMVVIGAVDCGEPPIRPCGHCCRGVGKGRGSPTDFIRAIRRPVDVGVLIPARPQRIHTVFPMVQEFLMRVMMSLT